MTKSQRAIIAVYYIVLAYWIPWHVQHTSRFSSNYVRSGYGAVDRPKTVLPSADE
jgi:hypothetical protein